MNDFLVQQNQILCDENRNVWFPTFNNNSVTIGRNFFTKNISNHIIKFDQYFVFFIWEVFFNAFINIIHII